LRGRVHFENASGNAGLSAAQALGPLGKIPEEDLNCLPGNPLHTLESDTLHGEQAKTLAHSFNTGNRYGMEQELLYSARQYA
jgi:hypothetical protein